VVGGEVKGRTGREEPGPSGPLQLRMPRRGGFVPRALVVASRLPCPGLCLGWPVGPEDGPPKGRGGMRKRVWGVTLTTGWLAPSGRRCARGNDPCALRAKWPRGRGRKRHDPWGAAARREGKRGGGVPWSPGCQDSGVPGWRVRGTLRRAGLSRPRRSRPPLPPARGGTRQAVGAFPRRIWDVWEKVMQKTAQSDQLAAPLAICYRDIPDGETINSILGLRNNCCNLYGKRGLHFRCCQPLLRLAAVCVTRSCTS
jgi:hypothetical protein